MAIGKRLRSMAVAGSIVGAPLGMVDASSVHAAEWQSGTVICTNGRPVVGMWVQSSGGATGWVDNWRYSPGRTDRATYTHLFDSWGQWHRMVIGCGGTPQAWQTSNWTPDLWSGAGYFVHTCYGNGCSTTW